MRDFLQQPDQLAFTSASLKLQTLLCFFCFVFLSALLQSCRRDVMSFQLGERLLAAPSPLTPGIRGLPVCKAQQRRHYIHGGAVISGMAAFSAPIVAVTAEKLMSCSALVSRWKPVRTGRRWTGSGLKRFMILATSICTHHSLI